MSSSNDNTAISQKIGQKNLPLPWYNKKQWLAMKAFCIDTEAFCDSYSEWQKAADKIIVEVTNRGFDVKLLPIYLKTFQGWCSYHRMQPNKNARKLFIDYLLEREKEDR